ncbi:hypothetical protein ACLQ16_04095 [Streptomyces albidoflavus]|uniref:hypothetical protein n=1 Tax=Streptomyces albidoflavus TaxID=1886 RepID=UPI000A1CD220|nr:hypothetical protein [Streptomyces albidoflavus]
MDARRIAQRFPLVARPRPACLPLTERVEEISALAETAVQDGGLSLAATALNKSALIVSDCGLPGLARDLCWRHAEIYLRAQPLGAQEARYALEPLVNLARLDVRDGDGEGAYRLLDALNRTLRHRTDTVIGDRSLSFRFLTATEEDHRTACQWLWTVLLGDGTRALVAANQWDRARAHVEQHKGVGRRLLDGRQVEIIARCLGKDGESARRLLDESTLSEAWEHPVAACLAGMCHMGDGGPPDDAIEKMAAEYLNLSATADLAVFRTRVGLTVLDLSSPPTRAGVARRLVDDALHSGDGYVARDVLAHSVCYDEMTGGEQRRLGEAVASAGLGRGSLEAELKRSLLEAVEVSARAVERHLGARHRP